MDTVSTHYDLYQEEGGAPIKMWTRCVEVEDSARHQLANVSKMPFVHKWVAVMPDVHFGIGATIGSVIPTVGAVIPAAVGVDIGCGVSAIRLSLTANDLPDNLAGIRSAIEAAIPHGRTNDGGSGDRGAWSTLPAAQEAAWNELRKGFDRILDRHPKISKTNAANHLGTVGGGNHFVELCLDKEDRVWIMLHSGSRGVGNKIGSYFINLAREDMRKWFINLPDKDLAYLPEGTDHFDDYVAAVGWAQDFARTNRELMMAQAVSAISKALGQTFSSDEEIVNCHHNYIARERHYGKDVWLTRKGAVCAREGVMGIIPGSMGARSFIVRGKGNPESFHSCSHGAGRRMSRSEAKRRFTVEDHIAATEGIECRKDKDVIDETPAAYKSIESVMAAQSDLVEIVHELHQVVCVKG